MEAWRNCQPDEGCEERRWDETRTFDATGPDIFISFSFPVFRDPHHLLGYRIPSTAGDWPEHL